jgi:hypothetical protein
VSRSIPAVDGELDGGISARRQGIRRQLVIVSPIVRGRSEHLSEAISVRERRLEAMACVFEYGVALVGVIETPVSLLAP